MGELGPGGYRSPSWAASDPEAYHRLAAYSAALEQEVKRLQAQLPDPVDGQMVGQLTKPVTIDVAEVLNKLGPVSSSPMIRWTAGSSSWR